MYVTFLNLDEVNLFVDQCVRVCVYKFSPAPSGSPANFQARALNSSSIHLSWDPLPSTLQNGIIRQYKVTLVDSTGQARVINTTITSVTVAALTPFTSYNFTVAAKTIALGPSTSPLQFLMPQDGKH